MFWKPLYRSSIFRKVQAQDCYLTKIRLHCWGFFKTFSPIGRDFQDIFKAFQSSVKKSLIYFFNILGLGTNGLTRRFSAYQMLVSNILKSFYQSGAHNYQKNKMSDTNILRYDIQNKCTFLKLHLLLSHFMIIHIQ